MSKVHSAATIGLNCEPVEVEADLGGGDSNLFIIVGLPDVAVNESKERVRSAIKNSHIEMSRQKIVINLAPADLKKEGPSYDLPISISLLVQDGLIRLTDQDQQAIFVGELSLDGHLRAINGILSVALMAKDRGFTRLYVPSVNAPEASLVDGLEVMPVRTLTDLYLHLRGEKEIQAYERQADYYQTDIQSQHDMAHVKGQENVKRALEISAAGQHNILMSGPPGSGKTMLARTMPTILPRMTREESLEVTRIYSVAGILPPDKPLVVDRPFRTPHHTASGVALDYLLPDV